MNIRKATLNDINNNLLNIYEEGYNIHINGREENFPKKTTDELKEDLINQIKKNTDILVLENDNKIAGFVIYEIKEKNTKVLWINQLVIDSTK